MHQRLIFLNAVSALFALFCCSADAGMISDPGLVNGERFRVIYVTPHAITATSSSRSTYDDFVTARGQNLEWQGSSVQGWNALAFFGDGTSMADVIDEAGEDVPFYRPDGELIANNKADLLDGSIRAGISINNSLNDVGLQNVWTGQTAGSLFNNNTLVGSDAMTFFGRTTATNSRWAQYGRTSDAAGLRLYGVSEVLQVGSATAVPELSSLAYFAMAAGGGLCLSRRKRRCDECGATS